MDNPIEEFLKLSIRDARVTLEDKWLYWSSIREEWVVREQTSHKSASTVLYSGTDLSAAVDKLRGEA